MINIFLVVRNKSDALTTEGKLGSLLNELYALDIGVTVVINKTEQMSIYIMGSSDIYQEDDISYSKVINKYREQIMESDYIAFIDDSYLKYQVIRFDESAIIVGENCTIIKTEDFHFAPTLEESISQCCSVKLISRNKFKLFRNILLTK